jgi:lycopene beta-cyclase
MQKYDYIFCGVGASASLLFLNLYKDDLLKDKKVLLIDQEQKINRDKTFCFWSTDDEK